MTLLRGRGRHAATALCVALVLAPGLVAAGRPPGPAASQSPSLPAGSPATPTASAPSSGAVNGTVTVSAITVTLELQQRAARAGQPIRATATVANQTGRSLRSISLELRASPKVVVRPAESRTIRLLPPAGSAAESWVLCGRAAGTYEVVASATVGGARVASPPRTFVVEPGGSC